MAGQISKLRLPKRPDEFSLERRHPLAKGLKFLMVGYNHGAHRAFNSVARGPKGPHGTLTNMDPATDWVYVPALGRWGLDYDGTDWVDTPISASLTTFAAIAWVRIGTAAAGSYSVITKDSPASRGWVMRVTDGKLQLETGGGIRGTGTTVLDTASWYHLAFVSDGINCFGYVNGVQEIAVVRTVPTNSAIVIIGRRNYNEYSQPWVGGIVDTAIWNLPLSASKIKGLYEADPMLDGLLVAPGRHVFPAAVATPAFNPVWAMSVNRLICNGNQLIGGGFC